MQEAAPDRVSRLRAWSSWRCGEGEVGFAVIAAR
jgi:hypothetical protein